MRTVGRYRLVEKIAQGGMGAVWRALAPEGSPVAVKLLRTEFADDPAIRDTIRNEVNVVARLNHPGIVRLRGWGEASEREAGALGLVAGAPWIAMDLAERSLGLAEIEDWAGFVTLASALLNALMHAHARGVVHRDIKPGNVLVSGSGSDTRYVLTDFGIAFENRKAQEAGQVNAPTAGTMGYMAPEQLLGHWRDFGPYTDLFSVGVLLQELVSGFPPFRATSRVALGVKHQKGAPPLEATRFDVPVGLADWLAGLLQFDPEERFAFAADAAHGLATLGPPVVTPRAQDQPAWGKEAATWTFDEGAETLPNDTWGFDTSADTLHRGPAKRLREPYTAPIAPLLLSRDARVRAPLRLQWRDGTTPPPQPARGIDLFGLQRLPMMGRKDERDAVWSQFLAAAREGSARGLVLRGAAGVGKSRLARWLCERAHELGAADFVLLAHSPETSPMPALLRQTFGLANLSPEQARDRVRELLGEEPGHTDLVITERLLSGESVGLGEQLLLLERLVRRFTTMRPLIAWFDDAYWSLDSLEAAARLTALDVPVLVVLTVREEELPALPVHADLLAVYATLHRVMELRVEGLPEAEIRTMVTQSVMLDEQLAGQVVAVSSGNPLHALQSLQLALQNGDARPDGAGRVVGRVGDESTAEIWLRRLAEAVDPAQLPAVLAAAVLGHAVDVDHWLTLCERTGIDASMSIGHRLLDAGLWEQRQHTWTFVHGSLRDALLSAPENAELRRRLHLAAAQLYPSDGARTFMPRGHHLLDGGDVHGGVETLLGGLRVLYAEGRGMTGRSMLKSTRAFVERAGVNDARLTARLDIAAAGGAYEGMFYDEALVEAARVHDLAVAHDWWEIAAHARIVTACVHESRHELDQALADSRQATVYGVRAGNQLLAGNARCRVGWALARLGRQIEARDALILAANETDDPVIRDRANLGIAQVLAELGEYESAERYLDECIEYSRKAGRRTQLADALNLRATLASMRAQYEEAAVFYSEAYRHARIERTSMQNIVLLNWAVLMARMGEAKEARVQALEAIATLPEPNAFIEAYGECVLLFAAATAGEEALWEQHGSALNEPSFHGDLEFAELFIAMAEFWCSHGDRHRAAEAVDAAELTLKSLSGPRADVLRARLEESKDCENA